MYEEMEAGRLHSRVVLTCLTVLLAFALVAPGVSAQDDPLHGAGFPIAEGDDTWIDPAETLGIAEDDLEPVPEIDLDSLNASAIYATGIEAVAVEDDTLGVHIDQYLRAHQVAATVQRQIDETSTEIASLRPRVVELNDAITAEREHEARLTFEIERINAAIAEFAVRAFIGDEDLEVAFSEPVNDLGETKVLSDGVRDAQFVDIANKEAEREDRKANRRELQSERRRLRSTIDGLQANRLERIAELRWVEELIDGAAENHEAHLHRRLTDTVDGADFQLVTLNAYVIAARTLAIEAPECAIEWWMLAGIGNIESLHGQIGDGELDANGFTSEPIYGPALDGRILEGEELIAAGSDVPAATGRTEDLPVAAAAAAVDPSADAAVVDGESGDEALVGADGEPVPVIRRLALIEDTDGGVLDDDTTYDRAVGPMQFIPQTWRSQEIDANGDGETDPQNIYDAAMASANYLCASTSSMATVEGQEQAYFAYNHDDEYTAAVIEGSQRYRALPFDLPRTDDGGTPVIEDEASAVDAPRTHWLGIGAFDSEAPTAPLIVLDLPDW